MQDPISLKSAERMAFQSTFADGLWDVFIGCFALEFAIAPLLSETMGDFWSSAIFLPFWGLVYLVIRLTRKYLVEPRMGTVHFGKARKEKMLKFNLVMVGVNTLALVLGILATLTFGKNTNGGSAGLFGTFFSIAGLFLLAGFSLAAYLLDYSRLYIYGLLIFAAPPIGEWLYINHGAVHHGLPIVFGITAGLIILTGLTLFVRLLMNYPIIDTPEKEA